MTLDFLVFAINFLSNLYDRPGNNLKFLADVQTAIDALAKLKKYT